MAESWQYIIGLLFIITILFFKGGIVGIVKDQIPALLNKKKAVGKTRRGQTRAKEAM